MAVGWVIVTLAVETHKLASATTTVYVPAHSPLTLCVVAPVDQLYWKGDWPVALAVAVPLHWPLHKTFVDETVTPHNCWICTASISFQLPPARELMPIGMASAWNAVIVKLTVKIREAAGAAEAVPLHTFTHWPLEEFRRNIVSTAPGFHVSQILTWFTNCGLVKPSSRNSLWPSAEALAQEVEI